MLYYGILLHEEAAVSTSIAIQADRSNNDNRSGGCLRPCLAHASRHGYGQISAAKGRMGGPSPRIL